MNKFYVYLHIKLDSGDPFYVGKGCGKRCNQKTTRNPMWKNIVNKHGYDIVILEDNLTNEESIEREIFWISRIGRRDLGNGPLCNMTDGGDGPSKRVQSKEERENRRINSMGELNPFYGRSHTQETKDKISKSKIGTKMKRTKEWNEKVSKALTGKKMDKETRIKISRSKLALKLKRPRPESEKLKISESIKLWWEKRKQKENE